MDDNERNLITLVDDETNEEHIFDLIMIVEIDNQKYAVLVPQENFDENEEEVESVIFRIELDGDGYDYLVDIDDGEEFYRVCKELDRLELENGM